MLFKSDFSLSRLDEPNVLTLFAKGCGAQLRYPRYNSVRALLRTRFGRCMLRNVREEGTSTHVLLY
jgi:hypothetical protein